jgi:hypothetical protein
MDETPERLVNLKLVPRSNKKGRTADNLEALLEHAQKLCAESGEGFSNFRARIAELQERLSFPPLVGQFLISNKL